MGKSTHRQDHEKLGSLAYNQIKAMITSGQVSHDQPIVERTLSKKLGMSRTPIKQALSRLQEEGLIRIVPRKGIFPAIITPREYQNILHVREVLEGLAARLSVDHFSNAQLRQLRTFFYSLGGIQDINKVSHHDYALANVSFHRMILQMSHNSKLIKTVQNLYDHISLVRLKTIEVTGRRNRSVDEHEAIIDALERRDADDAEKTMRDHIRALRNDIEMEVESNPHLYRE